LAETVGWKNTYEKSVQFGMLEYAATQLPPLCQCLLQLKFAFLASSQTSMEHEIAVRMSANITSGSIDCPSKSRLRQ